MADNSPLLKWLATVTGATNVYSVGPIANPTSAPVIMFSITATKALFVHRVTLVNDSTVPEIYVLQQKFGDDPWVETGRITVEPGLTWRGAYDMEILEGDQIRIGIEANPDATGNSWTHFEYLESSAR